MTLHSIVRKLSGAFRLELALLVAVSAVLAFEIAAARGEQRKLASEVLRLHVVANSNSAEDQALKLLVRDRILSEYEDRLLGFSSVNEAESFVMAETEVIEELAKSVLESQNCSFDVCAVLKNEVFPQKQYGDIILPAGEYRALRVVIGSGEGENWWCVMFPPLCCFAETESGEVFGCERSIATEDGVEVRFRLKILEVLQKLRNLRD